MSPSAFRTALAVLEIDPDTFAGRLGVHRATVYRWLSEGPPKYAILICELLRERQELARKLAS